MPISCNLCFLLHYSLLLLHGLFTLPSRVSIPEHDYYKLTKTIVKDISGFCWFLIVVYSFNILFFNQEKEINQLHFWAKITSVVTLVITKGAVDFKMFVLKKKKIKDMFQKKFHENYWDQKNLDFKKDLGLR